MISAFRELDPTVKFTVISGKAARTRSLHGVEAISRGDVRQIWRAMGQMDLLISGGGSLLQDVTGIKSIPYYLGIILMAKLRGLPAMFFAQGIGPVRGLLGRALVFAIGNLVDRVTVRDQESVQALRRLGVVRPPVTVTADAALALGPADPAPGRRLLEAAGVDLARRPVIGVVVRPWKLEGPGFRHALAQALDRLAQETGGTVVFIPMQQPQDVEAARPVAGLMQQPATVLEGDMTYRDVQSVLGACDVVVGMRYHALVFAALALVPVVGISYDRKNDNFLRVLEQQAVGTPAALEAEALVDAVRTSLREREAIACRYRQVLDRLLPLSRENAAIALELLKGWRRT
jgi:polysaccharide pyruvyl transferase CsaB